MSTKLAALESPTDEILELCETKVSDYVNSKRRNMELGDIIGRLNYELMFGPKHQRHTAGAALEKLGFVLD